MMTMWMKMEIDLQSHSDHSAVGWLNINSLKFVSWHTRSTTHFIYKKVTDRSRGRPEGSLFNSYYTEVLGRALLLSTNCPTLPLIRTLYWRVLSNEVSSTIFKVFGMTRPVVEPRFPGSLANTLPTRQISRLSSNQQIRGNALLVPFQLLEGPMEVLLCKRVNDLHHSFFHLLNCPITTASVLRE